MSAPECANAAFIFLRQWVDGSEPIDSPRSMALRDALAAAEAEGFAEGEMSGKVQQHLASEYVRGFEAGKSEGARTARADLVDATVVRWAVESARAEGAREALKAAAKAWLEGDATKGVASWLRARAEALR